MINQKVISMRKILDKLFSTRAAGMYMLLFAIAIAVATFVENDFGTSAAQKIIFKSRWFELLLILFGICIIVNVWRFRMFQQKKWAVLTFHLSIIIILLGAGITRYFGYEGMMHIREGDTVSHFVSAESYLNFKVDAGEQAYAFNEEVYFASLGKNSIKERYKLGDRVMDLEVLEFIPNPTRVMDSDENGKPMLKAVMAGANGREEYYLPQGDQLSLKGILLNFGETELPGAMNIKYEDNNLVFKAAVPMQQTVMATQTTDSIPPGEWLPLRLRSLYTDGITNIVFGDFNPSASVSLKSEYKKMKNESLGAVRLAVTSNNETKETVVYGRKGAEGRPVFMEVGGMGISVAYGARKVQLPFAIRLRDFIMERYPGTDNPSSYASEVTLMDPDKQLNEETRIYMNHILTHRGYRFFQSSYDTDELGTYLSVNHDFWGTWVSYIGYILLTLGLVMSFFSKNGRFANLTKNLNKIRSVPASNLAGIVLPFIFLLASANVNAFSIEPDKSLIINKEHAGEFGKLVVQDHRGRLKPVNTLTSEVIRKIARKESLYGLNAEQIYLGMTMYPESWENVPIISTGKHEKIKLILGNGGGLASYADFFEPGGKYKLMDEVRKAHAMQTADRGTFEKAIIKVDEKLNICNMIFTGRLLRIYPLEGDENNTWISPADIKHSFKDFANQDFINKFLPAYSFSIQEAFDKGDWSLANTVVSELKSFQKEHSSHIIPSDRKIQFEILLNKSKVFARLGSYYALFGLLTLVLFFLTVFRHTINREKLSNIGFYGLAGLFVLHTLGLAIRWYVSGRAPWSNGYESMIYIGWTTVLSGLIFARKSLGGLAATSILACTILLVATLSYLDPEITPLVPVLRSYWLTIHVSLEAGSYGFLMLGAIIGVLNLILMILINQKNKVIVQRSIKELTYISEMTLIGGLVMVSIGTYLGGVWANESWGRYWGWDAKETWALVTILVYAFILHMRFIPGLRGLYAFNVSSLFGFATVLMTYFGVNYYLSGLHSYAAGDPVPIPTFVYYTAASLTILSLLAAWRYRKEMKKT
jgi:cytochrome c-type biogenesis protein CcsB